MSKKLLNTRLISYITTNKYFNRISNDSTQGKPTETAIHDFCESVQKAIEKEIKHDCKFLRFITTISCILLHKLDTYNIRGVEHLLLKSYL